jgi:hypothetical protein
MLELGENQRDVAASTLGVSRNMQAGPPQLLDTGTDNGGGDLNGTAALMFFHQAGTSGGRLGMPRASPGNACGVV